MSKGAEEIVVSYFMSLCELIVEQRQRWLVKCKKRATKDRKLYRTRPLSWKSPEKKKIYKSDDFQIRYDSLYTQLKFMVFYWVQRLNVDFLQRLK